MTTNSFIASLRKVVSPATQRVLDAIADSAIVSDLIASAELSSLAERSTLAAELSALPAKHAKALKPAVAEYAAAFEAEQRAEEVLIAARARRSGAFGVMYGLESIAGQAERRIEEKLRSGASNLVVAASRAARAFSPARYAPDLAIVLVSAREMEDFYGGAEARAAEQEVIATNAVISARFARAEMHLREACGEIDSLALLPLTEADIAERITTIFRSLNASLAVLKGAPHFLIDEHLDAVVKFGHGQTAYTVKTADVGPGAEK